MRVDEVELPKWKYCKREVVEHPGRCYHCCINRMTMNCCLCVNSVILMKLFCWNYLQENWIPAKTSPLEAAKRELQEETGAVGKDYILWGTFYPSAGFCDEVLHLYFCKVASIGASHPDEDEFIEPILIPIEKAVEMVLNNEILTEKHRLRY